MDCLESTLENSLQAKFPSDLKVSILLDFTRGSRGRSDALPMWPPNSPSFTASVLGITLAFPVLRHERVGWGELFEDWLAGPGLYLSGVLPQHMTANPTKNNVGKKKLVLTPVTCFGWGGAGGDLRFRCVTRTCFLALRPCCWL